MIKWILIFILSFLLTGCAKEPEILEQPSGKILETVESLHENIQEKVDPKPDTLPEVEDGKEHIRCKKDGNVDDVWIQIVNQELDKLPESIRKAFNEDGWSIYVTDMDIDLTYYDGKYGGVMGSTNYQEKRILIEDREEAVHEAPIHEIGHWLDDYLGRPSLQTDFANIFEKESESFIEAFHANTVRDCVELFAEGYWHYIAHPQKLEMVAPNMYWFFKDLGKQI